MSRRKINDFIRNSNYFDDFCLWVFHESHLIVEAGLSLPTLDTARVYAALPNGLCLNIPLLKDTHV